MTYDEIPVDQLTPAADNPRRDLGDLTELTATIKALGVLEPLVVSKSRANGITVIAGHRRLAAATKAGLATVPCVVHADLDDRTRTEMMVVENLQRTDLTPLEEAVGYDRLVKLGHKQRELAKVVGRSQSHISKRVALLKLPEVARDALDSGGITIEVALELTKLPADEQLKLFKGGNPSQYRVEDAVLKRERARKIAAARAELAKSGVTVVDKALPWGARIAGRESYNGVRLTVEEHQAEPCHVAWIDEYRIEPHYGCTDPKRHGPDGESAVKAAPAPSEDDDEEDVEAVPVDETPEERAEREQRDAEQAAVNAQRAEAYDAYQRRDALVRELAAKGSPPEASMGFIATMTAFSGEPYVAGACELLGIAGVDNSWDADPMPLVEFINAPTGGPPWNALRALYALALAFGHDQARIHPPGRYSTPVHRWDDEDLAVVRPFLDHLVAQGHELSPIERWQLGDVEEETEAVRDEPRTDVDEITFTIEAKGKGARQRWHAICSVCGQVTKTGQTTEAYAQEAAAAHHQDEHPEAVAS